MAGLPLPGAYLLSLSGGRPRVVGPVTPTGVGEPIATIGASIHVYRVGP